MPKELSVLECTVAHLAAPGEFGGLERVVSGLVLGLRANAVSALPIMVLEPSAPVPAWISSMTGLGIEPVILKIRARDYLGERRHVHKVLATRGVRILHTHGYRADVVHGQAHRDLSVRTVSTVHGFTQNGIRGRAYEWIQRRVLRSFDGVVAVSQPLQRELVRSGIDANRVHQIPNALVGHRVKMDSRAAREILRLPQAARVVGWVGRFSKEKGPDLMIRAFSGLATPNTILVMMGDGPELAAAQAAIAENGLSARVRLTGARADAAQLMAAFDIMVVSSRTEGTPMAVLEAHAAGVPVVSFAVGGIPDLLGHDSPLLAEPESVAGLAKVVDEALLGQEGMLRAFESAHRRTSKIADSGAWIRSHIELYDSLLRGSPPNLYQHKHD